MNIFGNNKMSTKAQQKAAARQRALRNAAKKAQPNVGSVVRNIVAQKAAPVRLTGIPVPQGSPVQGGDAPVRLTGVPQQQGFISSLTNKLTQVAQDTAYGAKHPAEVAKQVPSAIRKLVGSFGNAAQAVAKVGRQVTLPSAEGASVKDIAKATPNTGEFLSGLGKWASQQSQGMAQSGGTGIAYILSKLGFKDAAKAASEVGRGEDPIGRLVSAANQYDSLGERKAGLSLDVATLVAPVGKVADVTKGLVKASTAKEVSNILKGYGIKGIAKDTVEKIAATQDPKEIGTLMGKAVSVAEHSRSNAPVVRAYTRDGSSSVAKSAKEASNARDESLMMTIERHLPKLEESTGNLSKDFQRHDDASFLRDIMDRLANRKTMNKVSEDDKLTAFETLKRHGIEVPQQNKPDTILQEARKYKSADAFVKAQEGGIKHAQTGKPVTARLYHGSPDARFAEEFDPMKTGYYKDAPDLLPDMREWESLYGKPSQGFRAESTLGNKGVSFTDSRATAKSYSEKPAFDTQNSVPMVLERYVTLKNPKVYDMGGKKWNLNMEQEMRKALENGHDGLVFKNILDDYHPFNSKTPANNIIALDTNAIKTRSQLTDIWNKANKKSLFSGSSKGHVMNPFYSDSSKYLETEARKYSNPEDFVREQRRAGNIPPSVRDAKAKLDEIGNRPDMLDFMHKNGKISGKTWNEYHAAGREYRKALDEQGDELTNIWKKAQEKSGGTSKKAYPTDSSPRSSLGGLNLEQPTPKTAVSTGSTPQAKFREALRSSEKSYAKSNVPTYKHTKIDLSTPEGKKKVFDTTWAKVREIGQDAWVKVKKLQRAEGIVQNKGTNPYEAKKLYAGRVSTRLESAKNEVSSIDKELLSSSKKLGVTDSELKKQVNTYLQSLHAPERNAVHGDGAAGMTTQEALALKKQILASPSGKEVARLAGKVRALNEKTLEILKSGQVISQEVYNRLKSTYKNHVPLNRILPGSEDVVQVLGGGKGINVKSTGIKRAKGSALGVSDILTNAYANVSEAIVRAEKNRVDLATLEFARNNKATGLFTEVKPKAVGQTFDGKPILERVNDPQVLTLRENGKPVYLRINDPSLSKVFQAVNAETVPVLFRGVAAITRFYSGLATRFKPDFAFSNKFRDIQDAMINVSANKDGGLVSAVKVAKNDPGSMKDVLDFMRGKSTEGTKLYEQMRMDGGTTGGMALSTRKNLEIDVSSIEKINRSNPRKAAEAVLNGIDNWNTIFEDSTRLSVYKEALNKGLSRDQAAVMAKDATLDFNTKGTGGSIINALYMFSNASIQGSTNMLRAMKNPKTATIVTASVSGSVWAVNKWNDMVDPEWRNKVSTWDRVSNFPIMIPSKEGASYITLPVSWGIKPIKVMADEMYDLSVGKGKGLIDSTKKVLAAAVDAYNPTGGTDFISSITPTVLDIPSEVSRNKSWSGSMIKPDWKKGLPNADQYYDSINNSTLGRLLVEATGKVSESTGRNIDISPSDAYYALNQLVGGAGQFVTKTINSIGAVASGNTPQARDIPFVSRFFKTRTEEETQSAAKRSGTVKIEEQLRQYKTGSAEQKSALQEYIKSLPTDEDRRSKLYILNQEGFDTKGVSSSKAVIEGRPILQKMQSLSGKELTDYQSTLSPKDVENYKAAKKAFDTSRTLQIHKDNAEEIQKIADVYQSGDVQKATEMLSKFPKDQQAAIASGVQSVLKKRKGL